MKRVLLMCVLCLGVANCDECGGQGECDYDSDCGSLEECSGHKCQLRPGCCYSDSDCTGGQVCKSGYCRDNHSGPPYPAGYALTVCGCWGSVTPSTRWPDTRCVSGWAGPRSCNYYICIGGTSTWQRICF